ncbi:MAG: Ppx/GppA family phosphatase [Syntrophomonadaceae bacterium]|nr:Ppx/GppA family phosphatase [Syntrophomonadaceae bacterium]
MRYGAVDIGTNSCRLLIAEVDRYRQLQPIYQVMETTRIGEGMDGSRLLGEEAMVRTIACLGRFKEQLDKMQVAKYRAVATSAVREAANRAEFEARVALETGMDIEVISGHEEARLSYEGVMRGLELDTSPLVVDLGGGSTEFIFPELDMLISVQLGAVRATAAKMTALQMRDSLKELSCFKDRLVSHPLVMVGGAPSTMVAIKKGMLDYRPDLVHGERLSFAEIGDLYELLESLPLELRRRLPGLQAERADIINKGALIMLIIMEVLGKREIIVSESDILHGIIWSLADADS